MNIVRRTARWVKDATSLRVPRNFFCVCVLHFSEQEINFPYVSWNYIRVSSWFTIMESNDFWYSQSKHLKQNYNKNATVGFHNYDTDGRDHVFERHQFVFKCTHGDWDLNPPLKTSLNMKYFCLKRCLEKRESNTETALRALKFHLIKTDTVHITVIVIQVKFGLKWIPLNIFKCNDWICSEPRMVLKYICR